MNTSQAVEPLTATRKPIPRPSRARRLWQSFRQHPGYVLMRGVARFALVRRVAVAIRQTLTTHQRPHLQRAYAERMHETQFPALDTARFVEALDEKGVAFGLTLSEHTVQAVHDYARNSLCYADRIETQGFSLSHRAQAEEALGKPILLAQYFNAAQSCPAIASLVNDPKLLEIAAEYLQSTPTFVGVNLWWTFPVDALEEDRAHHAHMFHRDVDDFRFFKFFFYLSDVNPSDGAHVCVLGSHITPPKGDLLDQWRIRRYTDHEIQAQYPPADILEICGKAGTGFAENTLCVHKGRTPTQQPRLLLQLQFALFDYGAMHDERDASQLKRFV